MKISVVTPSLNQALFIERTIESVRAQTGDFALKYLVVDGGSADGTLDVLERSRGRVEFTVGRDDGHFIPADLANFRWHGGLKSGARFREGPWEAFQTACRHATLTERDTIVRHSFRHLARVAVNGGLDGLRGTGPYTG